MSSDTVRCTVCATILHGVKEARPCCSCARYLKKKPGFTLDQLADKFVRKHPDVFRSGIPLSDARGSGTLRWGIRGWEIKINYCRGNQEITPQRAKVGLARVADVLLVAIKDAEAAIKSKRKNIQMRQRALAAVEKLRKPGK